MEKTLRQQPSTVVKVALFGPESTGKTTLSEHLARFYNSVWCPEYAREYLQKKWNNERKVCEEKDMLPIAYGQIETENELAQKATDVLICDTDLLETMVYYELYYNTCDPLIKEAALANSYDMYFLTYIDVPWEYDDLRDRPDQREELFELFKNTLDRYNKPYIILKGDKKQRLATATKVIDELILKNKKKDNSI